MLETIAWMRIGWSRAICHLLASSSGRKQSLPTAFDPKMPFSAGNNRPEAGLKVAFSVEPSNHLVFCRLYDENADQDGISKMCVAPTRSR